MAYIKRENKMDPLDELSVYVIFNLKKDSVFIWTGKKGNLRRNFFNHCTLRHPGTKAMFEEAQKSGALLEIYLLEDIVATKKMAYGNCLAWAKYFVEHGFNLVPYRRIEECCEVLTERQQALYNKIKDIPFEQICGPGKVLFRNFGQKKEDKKENKVVLNKNGVAKTRMSVPLSWPEYEAVRRASKEKGISMAAFVRNRILNEKTFNIDFDFAQENFKNLCDAKENLRQIVFAIYTEGSYSQADMKNIQTLVDIILGEANEIKRKYDDHTRKIKKELSEP